MYEVLTKEKPMDEEDIYTRRAVTKTSEMQIENDNHMVQPGERLQKENVLELQNSHSSPLDLSILNILPFFEIFIEWLKSTGFGSRICNAKAHFQMIWNDVKLDLI